MAKRLDMKSVNKTLSRNKVFKTEMRKKVIKPFESSKNKLIKDLYYFCKKKNKLYIIVFFYNISCFI